MRAVLLPHLDTWMRYLDLAGDTHGDGVDGSHGQEPVRVYLAGLGGAASADFAEVATSVRLRGARSLLVDLVGTGWSDPADFGYTIEEHADAVAVVLDALNLRGCTVVGHSLGGGVAISLAHRRPDLVGTLVAAEPNLDPGVGYLSRHVANQSEEAFTTRGYDALRAVIDRDDRTAGMSVFHATTGRWSKRGMYLTSVSMLAERRPTLREQLVAAPMHRAVLVGEGTQNYDLSGLREASVGIHVVPAAGHGMTYDNPAGFAHAIATAIAGSGRAD
ncbi:alpha/beta fold hydrolase [Actinopolymorpha pittospori]|uniref:Pimeloyl-ACP methyl ester carboxylesterase n=1 Tax=Actinopolymorpha pittospori TaxID=648752 RepID=A0A927N785_9ACTN|nr:alpha/beta hydrolase [Actinopolymorpha pittospori]MBE1609760.1 pimeloyl-ACP methyl ester carboxylesterase [Actinopolymorpha pittospori]